MAEFFEYDPLSGIRTDTSWNHETGEMTLHRSADVEPLLDYTKGLSNDLGLNRRGINMGHWLYAKIPPIVELQMKAKGINIYDPNDAEKMLVEINTHYPHLKCTTGKMGGKERLIV